METPNRKVTSGALAGALSVLVVYVISLFGLDVPGEAGAALATVFAFVTGYFVKN